MPNKPPSKKNAARKTIKLPESLKIKEIERLKQRLDKVLAVDLPVAANISAVGAVDYSGMQLLLAFTRELKSRDQKLSWVGKSEALTTAAEQLGVVSYMGLSH